MNKITIYDTVIIGGGIAGMYAFYKLQQREPNNKIVLLERGIKEELGGRMRTQMFHRIPIVMGAGVGRKRKDRLLQNLLQELKIVAKETKSHHYFSKDLEGKMPVGHIFRYLQKEYRKNPEPRKTFRQYSLNIFGSPSAYKDFTTRVGFTDYENEDIEETLFHYGFSDNYENWTALQINWRELKDKLVERIGSRNIRYQQEAVSIEKTINNIFIIKTTTNNEYYTKNVFIATTIDTTRKLLPQYKIYKEIQGQPFLRIYGKFTEKSIPLLRETVKGYTIVAGSLQKIIPIRPEKGIYMICYCDNERAKQLKDFLENTEENRRELAKMVEFAIGIPRGSLVLEDIQSFYWEIGTHYFRPLIDGSRLEFIRKAQNPETGIYVIGEAISQQQGWVEGALESVEKIL
jgi:hypothetical protein